MLFNVNILSSKVSYDRMLSSFMVTPEFHFASVWYAASTEGDLFCFLAFLNRRSHTRGYPVW